MGKLKHSIEVFRENQDQVERSERTRTERAPPRPKRDVHEVRLTEPASDIRKTKSWSKTWAEESTGMTHKPCERCWWGTWRHVGLPLWMCTTRTVVAMGFCHANRTDKLWYIMENTPLCHVCMDTRTSVIPHQCHPWSTLVTCLISSYMGQDKPWIVPTTVCHHRHCTLLHILIGCNHSPQDGRYNWRHDQTLRTVASGLVPYVEKAGKGPTSEFNNFFTQQLDSVQTMEQPTETQPCHFRRLEQKTYWRRLATGYSWWMKSIPIVFLLKPNRLVNDRISPSTR